MLTGMPISISLGLTVLTFLFTMTQVPLESVALKLFTGIEKFEIMAIPFFILAGELMNVGGISKRIIAFAMTLVGHIRGGLGYVAIITSVIFAGLSGSAVADTAALTAVLIPMMVAAGYDRSRSAALIAASGILAPVIGVIAMMVGVWPAASVLAG